MRKLITRFLLRLPMRLAMAAPRWFCFSIEVFIRHRFGQRYLTWGKIFATFFGLTMVLFAFDVIYDLFELAPSLPFYNPQSADLQAMWVFSYWLACIWHKVVIWYRARSGEKWYSQWPGNALEIWQVIKMPELLLFRFIEPLAVMLIGLLVLRLAVDGVIAGWLILSGSFLFVKRQAQYFAERSVILDMIDARAKSERLRAAIANEKPLESTDGFVVRPITISDTSDRREIAPDKKIAGKSNGQPNDEHGDE